MKSITAEVRPLDRAALEFLRLELQRVADAYGLGQVKVELIVGSPSTPPKQLSAGRRRGRRGAKPLPTSTARSDKKET